MFDVSNVLESIQRLAPRTLFAAATASGGILFAPSGIVQQLRLQSFREDYGFVFGIAFLVSACLLATELAWWIRDNVLHRIRSRDVRGDRCARLQLLTPEEKCFLRPYIVNNETTRYASLDDGVVGGLERAGILYRATQVGYLFRFAFNLQPWAREALTRSAALLNVVESEPLPEALRRREPYRRRFRPSA